MMLPSRFRERLERARENAKKGIIDDTEHFRGPTFDDLLTDKEAEEIRRELEAAGIKMTD